MIFHVLGGKIMFANMTTNMFEGVLRLASTGRTFAVSIVDNALPATTDVQPYRASKTSKPCQLRHYKQRI